MDENLHDMDDLFRKAINEHDDMPSASVWSNLDKSLDKKKVLSISKKYRKLKWAAAALLIFTAGMTMYTWHTKMRNQELVRMSNTTREHADKGVLAKMDKNVVADNAALTTSEDKIKAAIKAEKEKKEGNSVAANKIIKSQSAGDDKTVAATEVIKDGPSANVAKPSAARINPSSGMKVSKGHLAKEVVRKGTALRKEDLAATALNYKIKAGQNETIVLTEKKPQLKADILNSSNKKAVADIETVHEPKNTLFEIPVLNLVLERSLLTLTLNNKIKSEGKAANYKIKNNFIKTGKKFALSATLFYSPDFVSSKADNDRPEFREDDRNAIKSKEKITNTWTTGVVLNVNTGKKITLHTGLAFSTLTTNIQPKTIFARPDDRGNINYRFNCSAGYSFVSLKTGNAPPPAPGDSIKALGFTNTLQYLSVPLAAGYRITKGNFTLEPSAGVAANFLTKGSIETVIAGATGNEKKGTNQIEGLNKGYLSALLSMEVNYRLNKFLSLSFIPAARFALTSINKDAPLKTYLNSFGLTAGLKIGL